VACGLTWPSQGRKPWEWLSKSEATAIGHFGPMNWPGQFRLALAGFWPISRAWEITNPTLWATEGQWTIRVKYKDEQGDLISMGCIFLPQGLKFDYPCIIRPSSTHLPASVHNRRCGEAHKRCAPPFFPSATAHMNSSASTRLGLPHLAPTSVYYA
jgi:hypothetical protein